MWNCTVSVYTWSLSPDLSHFTIFKERLVQYLKLDAELAEYDLLAEVEVFWLENLHIYLHWLSIQTQTWTLVYFYPGGPTASNLESFGSAAIFL